MQAQTKIGDSFVSLADELPSMGAKLPATIGGSAFFCISMLGMQIDVQPSNCRSITVWTALRPICQPQKASIIGIVGAPLGAASIHRKDMTSKELKKAAGEFFANAENKHR